MRHRTPSLPVVRKNVKESATPTNQLPVLQHSEHSLKELRIRKSTSINHVLRVVERDPVLALELFISANRDLKRAGKPPATNIRRALLVFGLTRYLEHSKSYETLEKHLSPQYLRPIMNHLGRSYLAAKLAERLAQLRGQVYVEDAFSFGLMCDLDKYLGKLATATELTADPANLRTLLPGLGTPLITSNPLHWCADTAGKFAIATQYEWDPSQFSPLVESTSDLLNIDPYEMESELINTAVAVALTSKHFNDFPAARNLMNPGPQKPLLALLFPDQRPQEKPPARNKAKTPEKKAAKTLSRKTISSAAKPQQASPFLLDRKSLVSVEKTINKATQDLQVLGSTKSTRTRTIPFALNVITSVLKADKAFFIANASSEQFVVRLQAAQGTKPKAANTTLLAKDNLVLNKGMASGKPLHIKPQQLASRSNLFDGKLTKLLNGHEVYSIPLKSKNKVIGIVLARFDLDTTDHWPTHFNLCNRLLKATVSALAGSND